MTLLEFRHGLRLMCDVFAQHASASQLGRMLRGRICRVLFSEDYICTIPWQLLFLLDTCVRNSGLSVEYHHGVSCHAVHCTDIIVSATGISGV